MALFCLVMGVIVLYAKLRSASYKAMACKAHNARVKETVSDIDVSEVEMTDMPSSAVVDKNMAEQPQFEC